MLDSWVNGPAKNGLYLLRSGRGRDVPVLWLAPQKRISDTAAYHVGLKAMLIESFQDFFCMLWYLNPFVHDLFSSSKKGRRSLPRPFPI